MKDKLKVFLSALLIGMIASYLVCYKYNDNLLSLAKEAKITYFYVGTYNNLESATIKKESCENAIIYNDNGLYKVVIGAYSTKESIALMSSFFLDQGVDFEKEEMKVSSEFLKSSESYELLIKNSDETYYYNLNNSLLKLFNAYIS
ncbi:MAG: hypothetical protein NC483_06265 [Ruminococcus sp.]|nr:hypothetical protein [Ruminococcus sp.]